MATRSDEASDERLLIPPLRFLYDGLRPLLYPLLRFTAGALLVPHGWAKIVGGDVNRIAGMFAEAGLEPALPLAWYIGILELAGGACIALGLLTRFFAAQVVGFMAAAIVLVHWKNGFFWTEGGYEYPLLWGVVALTITIHGGGRLAFDNALPRQL